MVFAISHGRMAPPTAPLPVISSTSALMYHLGHRVSAGTLAANTTEKTVRLRGQKRPLCGACGFVRDERPTLDQCPELNVFKATVPVPPRTPTHHDVKRRTDSIAAASGDLNVVLHQSTPVLPHGLLHGQRPAPKRQTHQHDPLYHDVHWRGGTSPQHTSRLNQP